MRNAIRRTTSIIMALMMVFGCGLIYADAYSANAPFGNTGRNSYTHNDKFKGYLMVDGVDISEFQSSKCDFATAKKNNVDYVILRVAGRGYGSDGNLYIDDNIKTFYDKARKAGMMVGVYFFSQAKTVAEAKEEANLTIDKLEGGVDYNKYNFTKEKIKARNKSGDDYFKGVGASPATIELPVYMDYEYSGGKDGRLYGLKSSTAKKCAKAFCDTVRERGYKPGIYANTSFFKSMLENEAPASDVDLWCAQYYSKNESAAPYTKWQFTSTANIRGMYSSSGSIGSVDGNLWYIKKKPTSTDAKNIASCTIYGTTDWNYTGSVITPKFEIYNTDDTLLTAGKDYSVSYFNNVVKGNQQAYAYIRGMGGYSGYLLIPFTIGSGFINNTGLAASEDTATGLSVENYVEPESEPESELELEPKSELDSEDVDGEIITEELTEVTAEVEETVSPYAPTNYGFKITENRIYVNQSDLKVGNFLAGLKLSENEKYNGYTLAVVNSKGETQTDETALKTGMLLSVRNTAGTRAESAYISVKSDSIKNRTANDINRPLLSSSLTTTTYYYNGSAKKPGVVVNYNGSNFANGITASTTNVALSYSSGRTKPGTYYANVTGKTCPGTAKLAFKVVIKPASIKSLSSLKNGFKVKVNKLASSNVTGYQVRYSLYSNMKKATTKTISSKYSSTTKSIKKLKKKRTYFVQVRSYKKISSKKYYSSWSSARAVTTK